MKAGIAWLVACLGIAAPTGAWVTWRVAVTDKFEVYSAESEQSLLEFTQRIERFDQIMRMLTHYAGDPSPVRVRIYLVDSQRTVVNLHRSHATRVAGFYDVALDGGFAIVGNDRRDNAYGFRGETILFHEYAHHFMEQYFPAAYPTWYQEGMAEFVSTATMGNDGTVVVGDFPAYRLAGMFDHEWIGTGRLMNDYKTETAEDANAYYAQSWLLTHYFFENSARGAQLK